MDAEQDARLRRVENAVSIMIQQLCGEASSINDPWPKGGTGWATKRYGVATQPKFTLVDYLREIDRELNSRIDLKDRPGADSDSLYGQVLNSRAEVRALASAGVQIDAEALADTVTEEVVHAIVDAGIADQVVEALAARLAVKPPAPAE